MCQDRESTKVWVKIPPDLSFTGKERWKHALIDGCIAPLVEALQNGGIDMRGSCCGHGERVGEISLQDGRMLLILEPELTDKWWRMDDPGKKLLEWLRTQ